jgi:hypothetical protein
MLVIVLLGMILDVDGPVCLLTHCLVIVGIAASVGRSLCVLLQLVDQHSIFLYPGVAVTISTLGLQHLHP